MAIDKSSNSTLRNLNRATRNIQSSLSKLSSGKRIDKASVDPAGLAVATKMLAEASTIKVGTRNSGDARSAIAIAEGSISQLSGITTRLQELATQSANGTLSDGQRQSLQTEFTALQEEANRIVATTEFNGKQILSESFSVQVGASGDPNASIEVDSSNVEAALISSGFNSFDISTADSARAAIDGLSTVLEQVTQTQGDLGAVTARLEVAENNNETRRIGLEESASRITDVDFAFEVANLTKNRILQQASVALQAQAEGIDRNTVASLLG